MLQSKNNPNQRWLQLLFTYSLALSVAAIYPQLIAQDAHFSTQFDISSGTYNSIGKLETAGWDFSAAQGSDDPHPDATPAADAAKKQIPVSNLTLNAIPEPTSVLLAGVGLLPC